MVSYEIVHIHPDDTEEIIQTVNHRSEITLITEQPKYIGSWIREDRKLLRWAKGEIHIREITKPMTITSSKVSQLGSLMLYNLFVENGDKLQSICLNGYTMVGYDNRRVPLWQTNSFTHLADLVGKEVAWQVHEFYEKYLEEFQVKGAM